MEKKIRSKIKSRERKRRKRVGEKDMNPKKTKEKEKAGQRTGTGENGNQKEDAMWKIRACLSVPCVVSLWSVGLCVCGVNKKKARSQVVTMASKNK